MQPIPYSPTAPNPNRTICTKINSLFSILDLSGHLPFSIVFGLCRRSPDDTDPRPFVLSTAGSVLDVPFALGCGLLTLHVQDGGEANEWVGVDVRTLRDVASMGEEEWISLPSPVRRVGNWKDVFTVVRRRVDISGALASILEVGRKYRIRVAGEEDLGVRRWGYSNHDQVVDNNSNELSNNLEATRLGNCKTTAGNATFTVIRELSWPPRIETKLRLLLPSSGAADITNGKLDLEVSVLNTSPDAISVQTRGHQSIPIPWGPFQPDPDANDKRPRIIHPTHHKPPTSSLRIFDSATREMVRGNEKQGPCNGNADRRPKVEDVVVLRPGLPLIRRFDVGVLVEGLGDGEYTVMMQAKGCRWWHGDVAKEEGEDGRIGACACGVEHAPAMLESEDEVEVCVRDGNVER
ncbi:MAG: hypothetical protein LQ341_003092 [Variospora aurantia]|nr:MAG: hypothetical protein LQ341_003092 [Variospora aurantia]